MQSVDLIICGSVAVNRRGIRLGKGTGYSNIEVALLQEAGLIGLNTELLETEHDFMHVYEVITCDTPP